MKGLDRKEGAGQRRGEAGRGEVGTLTLSGLLIQEKNSIEKKEHGLVR